MTRIKQLKGFTLIELIVVVIIIGVLAAIAAVAYNQFVADARVAAAKANAKQVVTAASAYGQKNDIGAEAAITAGNDTLGIEGNVFIDDANIADGATVDPDGTPASGDEYTERLVTVYTGADASAKHFCVLDVAGELPVLKAETCK